MKKFATSLLSLLLVVSVVMFSSCSLGSNGILSGSYRIHDVVSDYTAPFESDTLTIGQKGSGKCIESFAITLNAPDGKDVSIAYRGHVQDADWLGWMPSGSNLFYAQYYGIDAVQFTLLGKDGFMYDLSYRIAVVGEDWQDWVSEGTLAGEIEVHRVIEAIEIRITPKEDYRTALWTITEWGDDSGNQAEFYTMKNNEDGTLIVVDGGWGANEAQARSVINLLGGRVDHWFLTHFDEDHASVFNAIYADPQGIEIGEVYATPLDLELYLQCAAERWWDTPWVYETFLEQTEGDDRIHYLSRDDVFEIDGLCIEVFNAYDQLIVNTGSADVANYASLMFKVTGAEDSILFCGDVYGGLWLTLSEMYGDSLQAEYVQPGHHGNNHVDPEAWAVVNAEVMFFDGPTWLTQSDDYNAKPLIEWCHENGIETYEYATAPNSVPFN